METMAVVVTYALPKSGQGSKQKRTHMGETKPKQGRNMKMFGEYSWWRMASLSKEHRHFWKSVATNEQRSNSKRNLRMTET